MIHTYDLGKEDYEFVIYSVIKAMRDTGENISVHNSFEMARRNTTLISSTNGNNSGLIMYSEKKEFILCSLIYIENKYRNTNTGLEFYNKMVDISKNAKKDIVFVYHYKNKMLDNFSKRASVFTLPLGYNINYKQRILKINQE